MNMRRKFAGMVLGSGILVAAAAGGATVLLGNMVSMAAEETESTMGERPEQDGSVMAKITAVGDSTITVVTAEGGHGGHGMGRPEGESLAEGETPPELPEGETLAEGETPPEKPEGEAPAEGETPPERPEGETPAEGETPPEKPEGESLAEGETPPERPEGEGEGQMGEMTFSEEETVVTISSSTEITKGMDQESASLSDLSADMVVRIQLDGTTAIRIDIMEQ
ncbi:MAG: hypothetical protein LIO92_06300 [Clostridiales bacterium]|nr:hypothetical protein [Clostridiales bacterium]